MTAPDLLRQLADCMEAKEALEAEVVALRTEVAVLRVKAAGEQEFLSVADAVALTSLSKSFFDQDRLRPEPRIPFSKAGAKKVLYRRADIEAFLCSRTRSIA